MTDLYNALETCLQALEQGQTPDSALARYPEFAAQLRPLLEVSLRARTSSGHPIPDEIRRRGRARLLQHAAQLASRRAPRRLIPPWPRLALAFGLAAVLLLSSTGLVNASSGALPGDRLYPVKRTWESLRLLLVFHPEERELLESHFEQERLDEIDELLIRGRTAPIAFSGLVTQMQGEQWRVSGIPLRITASTRLPQAPLSEGSPIAVQGMTRPDGVVEALEIRLLPPGTLLPPLEPSEEEHEEEEGREAASPSPVPLSTPPTTEQERKTHQFTGVLQAIQGNVWTINGQSVYVDQARIKGKITIGALVEFEGYYDASGKFIVTKIELKSPATDKPRDKNESEAGGKNEGNHNDEEDDHEQKDE